MAKTGQINLTTAEEALYLKSLVIRNRYTNPSVQKKKIVWTPTRFNPFDEQSLLKYIGEIWATLTEDERSDWNGAGYWARMTGWQLFVQDTTYRLQNEIPGLSIPSSYHAYFVGFVQIDYPGQSITIKQPHAQSYYVKQKVKGSKDSYAPVLVNDVITNYHHFTINYASQLIKTQADGYVKMKVDYHTFFEDEYYTYTKEKTLSLQANWSYPSTDDWGFEGQILSYDLILEFYHVQGIFLFDEIESDHDEQNFAIDFNCDNINEVFSGELAACQTPWVIVSQDPGCQIGSIYIDQ